MLGTATPPSFSQLRARSERRLYRAGLGLSTAVHLGLIGFLATTQLLAARRVEPIEYMAVQLMPAQALGSPDAPLDAQPDSRPQAPLSEPEPEPEPALPEPEPERVPAPALDPQPRESEPPRPSPREEAARPRESEPRESGARFGSATGSATSSSAFGGAEVAGFDNPDFVYGYYTDRMLGMIQAQWLRPALGGGVEATVHFIVHRDGSISGLRIRASSGYSQFDLAGLRAIQSAAPFPPLPQSYPHRTLGVNLIFR